MKIFLAEKMFPKIGNIILLRNDKSKIVKIGINQNKENIIRWIYQAFPNKIDILEILNISNDSFFQHFSSYLHMEITKIDEDYEIIVKSPFLNKVLQVVKDIPYGEKRYYSDIAIKLGDKKYTYAIGTALSKNPLPIIIPCHRVIPKNSKYPGKYIGGSKTKLLLLEIEELNYEKIKSGDKFFGNNPYI